MLLFLKKLLDTSSALDWYKKLDLWSGNCSVIGSSQSVRHFLEIPAAEYI